MSWRDDMWANWFGWTLSSTLIRAAAVAVCSSHKQTGTQKSNECNLKLVFPPPMRQANTYWTVEKTAIWDWYPLCLWCCCILPSIIFIVAVLFCFFALDSQRESRSVLVITTSCFRYRWKADFLITGLCTQDYRQQTFRIRKQCAAQWMDESGQFKQSFPLLLHN